MDKEAEAAEEDWHEVAIDVDYFWKVFISASTPLSQATALVNLSNAFSDLRTYLPGYDYETGTLPWEREDEEL